MRKGLVFAIVVIMGGMLGGAELHAQTAYQFSYAYTTAVQGNIGVGGNGQSANPNPYSGLAPWTYYTTGSKAQLRIRTGEGLPSGIGGENVGLTMVPQDTIASFTATYFGNDSLNQPFVMDLSTVGSSFTMTMGYAPNPATTGIHDGGANVADVGNQLMQMGMISVPSGGDNTLGVDPSLFISYREISAVAGLDSGSTTGFYEARNTNGSALGTFGGGTNTVTLQAGNASTYNYYVYETTYTNVGYESGEAIFNIELEVQAYTVNRTSGQPILTATTNYTLSNLDSDLTAVELETMRPAFGFTFTDTTKISVTGSTYDYFNTDIGANVIPEPAAFALVGLSMLALVPRRRRRTPAQG